MESLSPANPPVLQTAYEDWFITVYNVLYSSLPVLLVGLLDQVSLCLLKQMNPKASTTRSLSSAGCP